MSLKLSDALVTWEVPEPHCSVVGTTHEVCELGGMPLRDPHWLLVLLPCLQNRPALHIESLDGATFSTCYQYPAVPPYVARMRNVIDAESRDGLHYFPSLGGEDLHTRSSGDGEQVLRRSLQTRGRRRGYRDVGDGRRVLRRVESQFRGVGIPVLLLRGQRRGAFRQLQRLLQLHFGGHCGDVYQGVRWVVKLSFAMELFWWRRKKSGAFIRANASVHKRLSGPRRHPRHGYQSQSMHRVSRPCPSKLTRRDLIASASSEPRRSRNKVSLLHSLSYSAWAPYCLAIIRTFFVVAELARISSRLAHVKAPAPYNATPLSSMTRKHRDTSLYP